MQKTAKTAIRREMTLFPQKPHSKGGTNKSHNRKLNYHTFSESVENRGFSRSGKGGTKGKFSKMADFLGKLRKVKKIGNTSRTIA